MIPFANLQAATDYFRELYMRTGTSAPKSCLVRFTVGIKRVTYNLGSCTTFGLHTTTK